MFTAHTWLLRGTRRTLPREHLTCRIAPPGILVDYPYFLAAVNFGIDDLNDLLGEGPADFPFKNNWGGYLSYESAIPKWHLWPHIGPNDGDVLNRLLWSGFDISALAGTIADVLIRSNPHVRARIDMLNREARHARQRVEIAKIEGKIAIQQGCDEAKVKEMIARRLDGDGSLSPEDDSGMDTSLGD